MKQFYREAPFRASTRALVDVMNNIITEYLAQNFVLTVRQLYYQLVARGVVENTMKSYKRITSTVNDARLAGMMDWDAIEDRTRAFIRRGRWTHPAELVEAAATAYHRDMWEAQDTRVFVIVEKEALAGVLEGICGQFDVPLLAARGYPSATVLRDFARGDLMSAIADEGKRALILHLGDHDPSGIDMTRDLDERLAMFAEVEVADIELRRIALNMNQVEEEKPPPNPAKTTDARFESYAKKHGSESWELDALRPQYLVKLVRDHIEAAINDPDAWGEEHERIAAGRELIEDAGIHMREYDK